MRLVITVVITCVDLNKMHVHVKNLKIMKKVNKQCLLDTPCTVRVSEKTWQVIV